MTEEALSRELKTCGMAFFVTYFSELNSIDWYNNDQVEALKQEILNDLQSKARPDGGDYTYNGLSIRFSSLFIIFSAGEQWNALVKISNATRVPQTIKNMAKGFLEDEKRRFNAVKAEAERKQLEQQRRMEQRLLEEERLRAAKEQEEAERKLQLERRKNEYDRLIEERNAQERILAQNKRCIFGKRAEMRKEAKRKIIELDEQLKKYSEFQK